MCGSRLERLTRFVDSVLTNIKILVPGHVPVKLHGLGHVHVRKLSRHTPRDVSRYVMTPPVT